MPKVTVCRADDLPPGERLIVEVEGRSIGVFNVNGEFFALHNGCPHMGGPVCLGRVGGTAMPTQEYRYTYGREGQILRCAWHGWEFDIKTGRALADRTKKVRTYATDLEEGDVVVHI
jgi:nitrite reductase (NADH) small subunit